MLRRPSTYSFDEVLDAFVPPAVPGVRDYPCVFPNWDNTPRSGHHGMVLLDAAPEKFRAVLRRAMDRVADRPRDDRLVFIKSWNEWAEGNFIEPDEEFGRGFLEVIRDEVMIR
jgi:hypothetical protein